ncbi:adenine methyltransferase [Agrobacterium pusense]|uniref:site-specific DNA-methyltransferase n=1 Tax=Agrobacterium pusense TaxID=648995 RepID=UPI000929E812|nr:site-specific DNA-methyltransferase [Agrobacterium pusense]OJH54192.1 adenine methyltransferase [Agrobacterium pusense]OJH58574.1 adenine methyltransferase [Agrobacterium pusense]
MKKLELNAPETKSADIVSGNLSALQALFPDAFREGKIDFDVLKQLLGGAVDDREEKYGLNWHGKRQARQIALTPSVGTLLPRPNESVDWNASQNLMIEGDNLEALKLLQKSYAGKVKLIYIDPPYNTGKDFVYPDNFRDSIKNYLELTGQVDSDGRKATSNTETSGRFHTDWLNMMLPRLKVAKTLLRRDGVILISIDNQEISNLRLLCDEIFGAENFVSCMVWEKGRKNDAKLVSNGHEYVLLYANSLGYLQELKVKWREEKPGAREIWERYLELRVLYGTDDRAIERDLQSWFSSLPKAHPSKKWSRYKRVDKNGPWRDRDISWPGGGGPRYDVPHPETKLPCKVPERGWIYSDPAEMQRQIKLGLVEFRADHLEPPFRKAHIRPIPEEDELELDLEDVAEDVDNESEEEFANQVRGSYFYKQSQVSVKALRQLMGAKIFNNPKDFEEIARLIEYTTQNDPDAIVLDFFAGSGTTGQAVWSLNVRDGGNRRFILVQLPERLDPSKKDQKAAASYCDKLEKPRTIAELTKERLRRAGQKFKDDTSVEGDLGFRVFKLSRSNIRAWEPISSDLEGTLLANAEHIVPGRTEQDILYELLLKLGLDLCVPIETQQIAGKTVHAIGGGALMVCLADGLTKDVVESLSAGIVAWWKDLAPAVDTRTVFKDSGFADDVAKTNMAAILNQNGILDVRSL